MGVLWAAYKRGALDYIGKDLSQSEFTEIIYEIISRNQGAWIIEDKNNQYKEKYGPVGLVVAKFDGWAMEPHFLPFPWATPRSRLKSAVSFLMKVRYEKEIGVLNIYSRENDREFFDHLRKQYGVTYYVGKIPRGDYGHDKYQYYGRGGRFFKGIDNELCK